MTEQPTPATTTSDVRLATAAPIHPALEWAYRGCLLLVLITPFLPWFSMWAPEGWGNHADHSGISAGLTVLILLPTLAALAASFAKPLLPIAGIVSVIASAVTFLAVLLAIAAGRPSLKQFQDIPDVGNSIAASIQIQLIWGGWIALVLIFVATMLGVALNLSALLRLVNLERRVTQAKSVMATASPHVQTRIASAGDILANASQRRPWLKPAAIGVGAFLVALVCWTLLSSIFHSGGRTSTQSQTGSVPDLSTPKAVSVADARQAFLTKAKNMGVPDSILAPRAVQMVEEEKLRAGWQSIDEMMYQATPDTQEAYQQYRQAVISQ